MNKNPHLAPWLNLIKDINPSFESIKRIDKDGILYYCDYTSNYYNPVLINVIKKVENAANFKPACSAFLAQNTDGDNIHARNYDFPHYINNDKTKGLTGLNVVVHTKPGNGLHESIGIADGFWLDFKGNLYNGTLDDEKSDISNAAILPYICMDGINDAGLVASILMIVLNKEDPEDIKTNMDEPNKIDKVSHARLIRYILDNCSTVKEAIELASKYNVFSLRYSNFHLFITDKDGNAEVLEWRFNKFTHYPTNIVTNFNVCGQKDDGCDIYENGKLTSRFSKINNTLNDYHYGYGKGFDRFETLVSILERNAIDKVKGYKTDMRDEEIEYAIQSCTVKPSKAVPSLTQYSVTYNSNKLSLKVWCHTNINNKFEFKL